MDHNLEALALEAVSDIEAADLEAEKSQAAFVAGADTFAAYWEQKGKEAEERIARAAGSTTEGGDSEPGGDGGGGPAGGDQGGGGTGPPAATA